MAISVDGLDRGVIADVNVVPLIDVLLVLLVIFMIIPHKQFGLQSGDSAGRDEASALTGT